MAYLFGYLWDHFMSCYSNAQNISDSQITEELSHHYIEIGEIPMCSPIATKPNKEQLVEENIPVREFNRIQGDNYGNGTSSRHVESDTIGVFKRSKTFSINKPFFAPLTSFMDSQISKCVEFHPEGEIYAVGSNAKTLRICKCPDTGRGTTDPRFNQPEPEVLFIKTEHHKDDINCLAWNPAGDLLASGSRDNIVKVMHFNSELCTLDREEAFINHKSPVNVVSFTPGTINTTSRLVIGGAGEYHITVRDYPTLKVLETLSGHSGEIVSLYSAKGMLVSGSQDNTVRIWDYRLGVSVSTITAPSIDSNADSTITCLDVDQSMRQLVCGKTDGLCALYDMRVLTRVMQEFTPHTGAVRSVRFSPGGLYLLTAGDDGNIVLTNMQDDLVEVPPQSLTLATHPKEMITARWHPERFSFVSTSLDKTSVFWATPRRYRDRYNKIKDNSNYHTLFKDLHRVPPCSPGYWFLGY